MMTRQAELHRAIEQQILGSIPLEVEEEYLLDLYDEDLPEDDDLNCHPNLYADGELLDVYSFMEI